MHLRAALERFCTLVPLLNVAEALQPGADIGACQGQPRNTSVNVVPRHVSTPLPGTPHREGISNRWSMPLRIRVHPRKHATNCVDAMFDNLGLEFSLRSNLPHGQNLICIRICNTVEMVGRQRFLRIVRIRDEVRKGVAISFRHPGCAMCSQLNS